MVQMSKLGLLMKIIRELCQYLSVPAQTIHHYWTEEEEGPNRNILDNLETFSSFSVALCMASHYNSLSAANQIITPVWNLH